MVGLSGACFLLGGAASSCCLLQCLALSCSSADRAFLCFAAALDVVQVCSKRSQLHVHVPVFEAKDCFCSKYEYHSSMSDTVTL